MMMLPGARLKRDSALLTLAPHRRFLPALIRIEFAVAETAREFEAVVAIVFHFAVRVVVRYNQHRQAVLDVEEPQSLSALGKLRFRAGQDRLQSRFDMRLELLALDRTEILYGAGPRIAALLGIDELGEALDQRADARLGDRIAALVLDEHAVRRDFETRTAGNEENVARRGQRVDLVAVLAVDVDDFAALGFRADPLHEDAKRLLAKLGEDEFLRLRLAGDDFAAADAAGVTVDGSPLGRRFALQRPQPW